MRALLAVLVAGATLAAPPAFARGPGPGEATPWDGCFAAVGAYYKINPLLLKAIARQESSMNPNAIGKNTNGTVDMGLMQINSIHLPKLARAGIRREQLLDPCTNIAVGGWVLADAISRHGMSWTAVGAYHSPTAWRRVNYAAKVQGHLMREIRALQARQPVAPAPSAPAVPSVAGAVAVSTGGASATTARADAR